MGVHIRTKIKVGKRLELYARNIEDIKAGPQTVKGIEIIKSGLRLRNTRQIAALYSAEVAVNFPIGIEELNPRLAPAYYYYNYIIIIIINYRNRTRSTLN